MIQKISEDEATHALITELCSGRKFLEENLKYRETDCSREIKSLNGTHPVLGKAVLNIPQEEFYFLREKYGADAFHDRGFVRDMGRLNPHLRGARI